MRRPGTAALFAVLALSLALAVEEAAIYAHPRPDSPQEGALAALVFFLLVAAAASVVLLRRVLAARDARTVARDTVELDREQRILHAAEQAGGRVTAAELAAHADLSIADVETTLASLERSGIVTSRVSSQGAVVYLFAGLAEAKPAPDDI